MPDLRMAYRLLSPGVDLAHVDFDSWYVPRPADPVQYVVEELRLSSSPLHILLAGQRGVGKTTECARIARALPGQTITANVWDRELGEDPDGLLTGMLGRIEEMARSTPRPKWATTRVTELIAKSAKQTPETSKISLSQMVDAIAQGCGSPAVLVIDGLEKWRAGATNHGVEALRDLDACVVVAVSAGFLVDPDSTRVAAEWDRRVSLPAVAVRNREGDRRNEPGIQVLRNVVTARAGTETFAPDALDEVVLASGGIHRDLLALAQMAAVRAGVAGEGRIGSGSVASAIEERRQEYSLVLSGEDLEALVHVQGTGRVSADPVVLGLVGRNLVISYYDQWTWFGIHPLVEPLVQEYRLRSEV